jgi:hypothetical protein
MERCYQLGKPFALLGAIHHNRQRYGVEDVPQLWVGRTAIDKADQLLYAEYRICQ